MTPDQPKTTRRDVLKTAALGAAACVIGEAGGAEPAPVARIPRSKPGALGVDPGAVAAFVDAVNAKVGGLHGFILLRHGKVAAESWWHPYGPSLPHMLFSLSKSFTSTAVGFAVTEGRLSVDSPVLSFFPGDAPATVSENLAAMRVRHLLTMSTGHDTDATGAATSDPDGNWVRGFLADPVTHVPGTHFVYNSAATYMLSAIVQKLTGMTVLDYLTPRLFQPLGIVGATWEKCPKGINTGGWGLSIKTEDIARFGQMLLHKGQWQGHLVVPAAWLEQATSKQISNGTDPNSDWAQGYGYQFWRCRHGAFRGDGAFGQYCLVMPEQDAVLAVNSGVGDMGAILNAVWDHLLPGMKDASVAEAKSEDDLKRKLAQQSVTAPAGAAETATAKRVSGRVWRFGDNPLKIETVTVTFGQARCRMVMHDSAGDHTVEVGYGEWVRSTVLLAEEGKSKAAARGAWTSDDTFTVKVCYVEKPFEQTLGFRFTGDQVTVSAHMNVGFGPTEVPPMIGHLA